MGTPFADNGCQLAIVCPCFHPVMSLGGLPTDHTKPPRNLRNPTNSCLLDLRDTVCTEYIVSIIAFLIAFLITVLVFTVVFVWCIVGILAFATRLATRKSSGTARQLTLKLAEPWLFNLRFRDS